MTSKLRMANEPDVEIFWQWRNDPVSRANSITTDPIPWKEHQAWFARRMADPDVRMYVLEDDICGPVAQVRYERRESDCAEVHLTVAPALRGRGFGTRIIEVSLPLVLDAMNIRRVAAIVREDNAPSLRMFLRAGFILQKEAVPFETAFVRLHFERS